MKHKHLPVFIFSFLIFTSTFLQAQPAIIERIIQKDSNLFVCREPNDQKLIIASVIDKKSREGYLFSRYGEVIDSFLISDADFLNLLVKKITLVDYRATLCDRIIGIVDIAQIKLRAGEKINPQWQFANIMSVPSVKEAPGTIGKIIALDNVRRYYADLKWRVTGNDAMHFKQDSATIYTRYDLATPGTMFLINGTTIYYNGEPDVKAYKAILINKDAKILYYDRNNSAIDSMQLNPLFVDTVIADKIDVFHLYRRALETQKQLIEHEIRELTSIHKKYAYTYIRYADNKTTHVQDALSAARESLLGVEKNIQVASVSDIKAIVTRLKKNNKNQREDIPFCTAVGIGWRSHDRFMAGQTRYELTDHRGNVIAVISDKKIGHSSDGGRTVDYYMADVLSETDYSSFGAVQPGREIITETYRYGYNGKENDSETGFQDYGFRSYDTRIGRFTSGDPLTTKFPYLTPYQFASNSPIQSIDLDGLESVNANTGETDNTLNPKTIATFQKNKDAKPWQDLIAFVADKKIIDQMNNRFNFNPSVLHIETAVGSKLNLDYYSTTITKLPKNMNASQLQEYIRQNFSAFINDDHMIFDALDKEEGKVWNSNNPASAVMSFKQDVFLNTYTEGASVLTSKINTNFWTFTTLFTPFEEGSHPVSGTRQFGLAESNITGSTNYTFFTRGADRTTSHADSWFSGMMFNGADRVWSRLITNVANFVIANGGEARINEKVSKRINWKKDYLPTLNK